MQIWVLDYSFMPKTHLKYPFNFVSSYHLNRRKELKIKDIDSALQRKMQQFWGLYFVT